ncbi:hypothetical protein DFH29DRAFT_998904 [Suillus ampliporus]|nr:hypothetical protein DFH29DRAFT_998904 [Suillus ampliporus]
MSIFPTFHMLNTPDFPTLSTSSPAEQASLPLMDTPLYHQKSADLAALDAVSRKDLIAICASFLSKPCAHSLPINHPIAFEESPSQFTAAIRTKPPHPRVAHACDHCRRRKTKVSPKMSFHPTLANVRGKCSGDQPACDSCKKKGRECQWTPLKTTKDRRSRKPYDISIEYKQRARAPTPPATHFALPTAPYIAAPRMTYPSVMLPNPWALWSTEDAISAPQAVTIPDLPIAKSGVQGLTGWSAPAQDWQDIDLDFEWSLPSPPSSCPSLTSEASSCASSPPHTPVAVEEVAPPNSDEMDAFFRDLFQSPEWSTLPNMGSAEVEMPFIQ